MVIVILMGNLGGDPEVRFAASGQKITTFNVASNSKKQGKDETTWYRVTIFGDRFDKMLTYLKKGSSVIVNGELNKDTYTDREGRQQTSLNVIADSVKFSPFGRPDRPQEQTAHGATTPSYAPPSYAPAQEPRSYGPSSYSPPQQQQPHQPQQPYAAPLHDFGFGDVPAESMQFDQNTSNNEAPF